MTEKRVVITGMGTVSPLGNSVEQSWQSVINRTSGIAAITHFDASHLQVQIAGEVRGFEVSSCVDAETAKKTRRMDRFCHYALGATREAWEQAGLSGIDDTRRIGIGYGSGIGGLNVQHDNSVQLETKGPRRVNPFYIPMSIGNMAAGVISMVFGAKGPNISLQTACATANHSIGLSALMIKAGMADVMISGASEGSVSEIAVAGFGNMRALSTRNDDPAAASRPYDVDRDGFVLSEGAATLVLEDYEHAKRRGATILCEVLSCGMSGDAYDFVAPDPSGTGAQYAMEMALSQAGVGADVIDYVNTHGTSTPAGDIAELRGIHAALGPQAERAYIGSTKSYHGHLLGATAGLEAVLTIMALRHNLVPGNLNLDTPDPELPRMKLPTEHVETPLTTALSNSFGFGGHNSSLLLRKL
ncbi:MAG: beta-ketoacyl-[acyl-carrier-protein] synthase II [Spirochaetaceae bacterium]|nr:MAG: beta-ketoacyl-[acyl-carrier-protein] synthase II [Spirochaetaceae bacterium]